MKTLNELLDEHRHLKLRLAPDEGDPREWPCYRPNLTVWPSYDEHDEHELGPAVTLSIGDSWGERARFIELKPPEARRLAAYLIQVAGAIEIAQREQGIEVAWQPCDQCNDLLGCRNRRECARSSC